MLKSAFGDKEFETGITEGHGGGVSDVVSFLLRVIVLCLARPKVAPIMFLDEVFNGSSAILNSLLSLLNERCFFDRGRRVGARYQIFLGATQHPPAREELVALYDRFTVRIPTDWVDERQQRAMLLHGLGHRLSSVEPTARTPPQRSLPPTVLVTAISTTASGGTLKGATLRSLVSHAAAVVDCHVAWRWK